MEIIIGILVLCIVFAFVFGWASGEREKHEREKFKEWILNRDYKFQESFCLGRKWLADFIAECRLEYDESRAKYLESKKHPARKSAEVVREIKNEKKELIVKLKFLEYQLKTYEEYFPFLEEYKEIILDEQADLRQGKNNIEELQKIDPVNLLLSKEEYEKLSIMERNQLALDRYLGRTKNNWEIGRLYERYIGYLYELENWIVEYHGAIMGYEDFGRDLICTKNTIVHIVQAKCWSKEKVIREKHLFQLFGSTLHYRNNFPNYTVNPVFVTTTALSEEAREVAGALNIEVRYEPLDTNYPMIKCNINPQTKEKIYHLPMDQQYDKVVVGNITGERYVKSVQEAEASGFRRAWRYVPQADSSI